MDTEKQSIKEAKCACGKFRVQLRGDPEKVYGCACTDCQRLTGSVFAYRAMYPKAAIVHELGRTKTWHRPEGPGSWIENVSCDHCGTVLYQCGAGIPGRVSVSVGCFNDASFSAPTAIYFGSRSHAWLQLPIASVG